MRETVGATRSRLIIFFNPKEFAIVNLLPQEISFTAAYFVDNGILPLTDRHAQQLGISAGTDYIYISTIPSTTLLGMSKNR
jgi:hypothetical protein